ncbi:ArsR/SmtB family transcription factor [Agromyces allii]|uniref:Metalloregulator ArsR/SmtB family transcription factor n=1 Tax=Agromyces allii TaxID=393607 RepID=A0ABN2QPK2_9MICO|nr:metalloregulator ArsR/SmtB family transcription factor [Agromyces allii]
MLHPFEIVAEPVRRRIIEILAGGSHPAGMLGDAVTAEFGISRSAVSHHLRILRDAGVVSVVPDLTVRHYRLDEQFLHRLDDAVGELFLLWDHRYGFESRNVPIGRVEGSRVPQAERLHRAGGKGRRGTRGRSSLDAWAVDAPD